MLFAVGVALCALSVGVDEPGVSDAAILDRLDDGARQTAAGIGLPVLAAGVALLLWFTVGLRRVLDRLSGGDPLAHAVVPAAALLGGLVDHRGRARRVERRQPACRKRVHPRAPRHPARVLGTAGALVGLTGLTGGAVLVAVTTRIAQRAHALPTWALWVSYAVAVLCLSGFWSAGMASVAFALWLIGAVIGVLRAARADTIGAQTGQQGRITPARRRKRARTDSNPQPTGSSTASRGVP